MSNTKIHIIMQRNHNETQSFNTFKTHKKWHAKGSGKTSERERKITAESKTKAVKQKRKYILSLCSQAGYKLQGKAISEVVFFLLLMFLVAFSFYCLFPMCAFTRPFTTYMNVDNFFPFCFFFFCWAVARFAIFFFFLWAKLCPPPTHITLFFCRFASFICFGIGRICAAISLSLSVIVILEIVFVFFFVFFVFII